MTEILSYLLKFKEILTKVLIIGGKYQNIKAGILNTSVNAIYNVTDHIGLRFGVTYFDTSTSIDNPEALYDIDYGYKGVDAGLYFAF